MSDFSKRIPKSIFKRNAGAVARDDNRVLNDAGIWRGGVNHALYPRSSPENIRQVAYLGGGFALELRRAGSFFVQRIDDFPELCLALCVCRGTCARV